jgi:hypothetical protein
MRRLGADCFVVVMKRGNARGAKGAGHALVQTFQLDAIGAVAALFDGQPEGAPEFSTEAVNGKPLLRRISSAAAAALSSFSCRPRTIILNHMPLDRNQWVMG